MKVGMWQLPPYHPRSRRPDIGLCRRRWPAGIASSLCGVAMCNGDARTVGKGIGCILEETRGITKLFRSYGRRNLLSHGITTKSMEFLELAVIFDKMQNAKSKRPLKLCSSI